MGWFLLAILLYIFLGALIVMLSMRKLVVTATAREWLTLIFMWPFLLKLFAHLAMTQAMIKGSETLEINTDGDNRRDR